MYRKKWLKVLFGTKKLPAHLPPHPQGSPQPQSLKGRALERLVAVLRILSDNYMYKIRLLKLLRINRHQHTETRLACN